MAKIEYISIEVDDTTAASRFYSDALGLDARVRVRKATEMGSGFRGFTLSLVMRQPADADQVFERAVQAGATTLKPAEKSLWGYGGSVQAPDGTIVTIAASSKKDSEAPSREINALVVQLGVTDVAESKRFYADHGFTVAKSFGRKYAELDTGPITLTLNKRDGLAKVAGVPAEGSGSHHLAIAGSKGPLTDPDGFVWERPTP